MSETSVERASDKPASQTSLPDDALGAKDIDPKTQGVSGKAPDTHTGARFSDTEETRSSETIADDEEGDDSENSDESALREEVSPDVENVAQGEEKQTDVSAAQVDKGQTDLSGEQDADTHGQDGKKRGQTPRMRRIKRRERRAERKLYKLTHFDNRSFLALLVRSFLSFMFITVAATIVIVLISSWTSRNTRLNNSLQNISSYDGELRNNTFAPNVPVDVLFGTTGWLDIVDASTGKIVYSSAPESGRKYMAGELDCISTFGKTAEMSSTRFAADDGYNYLVSWTYASNDKPDEYLLLGSDYRVISTNNKDFADRDLLTKEEFDLLVYNSEHGGHIMEKYAFKAHDGGEYYAVYLDTNNSETRPPWLFVVMTILGIIGLLIVTLTIYIRYINKHVQRPIKALGNAMVDFAKSGYREQLNYSGSKDFEQLVNTFNDMVTLLNASEEQRVALEQDRQRMLAGLSHDLKTPITVIDGFAKAIRDGVVSEADKPKYINLIISKSEHMSELINEFYEYSKLDHPDFSLNAEPTDVAEFVRVFLAEKYDEFDICGYELVADIPDSRLICDIDREQFTRVLDNLVSNFFKYTPAGSTLAVSAKQEGDLAIVCLADNGGGIGSEARKDIFSPFVVGEKSRNKQGTGLGLAVCKRIVDLHGGKIELCDAPEGYTTLFKISLPMLREDNIAGGGV